MPAESKAEEPSRAKLMTQAELFKNYMEMNQLYVNIAKEAHWFEYGGNKVGRLYFEGPLAEEFSKWRLIATYRGGFPGHFTTVFTGQNSYYLMGGTGNNVI